MERIELKDIMEELTDEVIDKDGNKINNFDPEEFDIISNSVCHMVKHITPLGLRITSDGDTKNIIHVLFLFKFKSDEYNIVEAQYSFDRDKTMEKLFQRSAYGRLVNDKVLDYIIDSHGGKITKIDMKFKEYDNGSDLLVLPCIDDNNNYKALFVNKRQLAQLAFIENYFLNLNMNDRILYKILKDYNNDNIFDYTVTFVNGIERVAKAGKHTIACTSSFECLLDDNIQDIHTLSSHDCGVRVKRRKMNCKLEDLKDQFGKSRREFIVEYMADVNINNQDNLLIKAENVNMGEVIIRLDKYNKDDYMEMLDNKTSMK